MKALLCLTLGLCLSLLSGCLGCNNGLTGGGTQGDGPINLDAFTQGLTVNPPVLNLDVSAGTNGPTGKFTALNGGLDVTVSATWISDDTGLGVAANGVFTPSGKKGGSTTVRALWNGMKGQATVNVKLHATISTGCPGCPKLPDPGGPSCPAGTAPTLVYPPDGVLLPPNMNVLQVQFAPGTGTKYYEVDFSNATVDIRAETQCNAITDTRGAMTPGCSLDLDQTTWDYLSKSNAGGDPVKVTVRASTDGSCATPSAMRQVSFAQEPLLGGLYYWQSLVVGGVAGKTGGIFRYDFGSRGATSQAYLTPASGSCVGCHFLSRDGQRMTYSSDDDDSDDEYSDMHAHLLSVADKGAIATNPSTLPPGFQTFTHDHKQVMASTGQQQVTQFQTWNGETGGNVVSSPATGMRGTQPDWSADDSQVVYVVPQKFSNNAAFTPSPYARPDDDHFMGGSLYTISYKAGVFGAPQALVTSAGENNYYPSFSPDVPATFVVFNRVSDASLTTDLAKDAFNNPYAQVWIQSTKAGSKPLLAAKLNDSGQLTNSWPRWSPFVQTYKGQRLLWVTFSSTRDYGLKVRNHVQVPVGGTLMSQINCFPPDSPQNPNGSHGQPLPANCNQPQIWMAAINLDAASEFPGGGTGDPSYPAFWLPFQDVTAHNHIAQWTQTVVSNGCGDGGTKPAGDGGVCLMPGEPCGNNICGLCCGMAVCQEGQCVTILP